MSAQNISENSSERYVINSYGVPEEIICEGADLVSLCGIQHIAFIMDGNGRGLHRAEWQENPVTKSEWMLSNV